MKYTEELHWRLDNKKIPSEEQYRQNIEFVHSLGLKCSSVGWSTLNLLDPRANEILDAINLFCKKNGWKARGVYKRNYIELESDWFELVPMSFNYNTVDAVYKYKSMHNDNASMIEIRAYHETKSSPKWWYESIFVPERFRSFCLKHNITDVDFCWVKDNGKYEAEQYFLMRGNNQIPNIIEFNYHDKIYITNFFENIKQKKARKILNKMDGSLPRLAKIFPTLQQIILPVCYLETDMPNCYIAHAYTHLTYSYCGRNKFLIHKSFAELLLKENVIPKSALIPAIIVNKVPKGYTLKKTEQMDWPLTEYVNQSIKEYEKLKGISRPTRMISEKEALKIFRKAKQERKEDFKKAMSKTASLSVAETKYGPLIPFYLIANGAYLSYDYELLSYDKASIENNLFVEELSKEEILEEKIEGIVFATCGDGDSIIFCDNGKVVRISHEDFNIIEEWLSLPLFIVDALND